jgi:predicted DNA binding protein
MRILIHPNEIVELCLWDAYAYYVVRSESEAEKILKENSEIELSTADALVIGLLKVIETDNLVHRFNDHLIHILNIKSVNYDGDFLIKRKSLTTSITKFKSKFPSYYQPSVMYQQPIKDVIAYIDDVLSKIELLPVKQITDSTGTYEFQHSNSVRKLLNFHHF